MNEPLTITMILPYILSSLGFFIALFVMYLMKGQSDIHKTLAGQSKILAKMQETLDTMVQYRLPKIDDDIEEIETKVDALSNRMSSVEAKLESGCPLYGADLERFKRGQYDARD